MMPRKSVPSSPYFLLFLSFLFVVSFHLPACRGVMEKKSSHAGGCSQRIDERNPLPFPFLSVRYILQHNSTKVAHLFFLICIFSSNMNPNFYQSLSTSPLSLHNPDSPFFFFFFLIFIIILNK